MRFHKAYSYQQINQSDLNKWIDEYCKPDSQAYFSETGMIGYDKDGYLRIEMVKGASIIKFYQSFDAFLFEAAFHGRLY